MLSVDMPCKIQHPFMKKAQHTRNRVEYPQAVKNIKNPTVDIIMVRNLKFPAKSEHRKEVSSQHHISMP